jgi:hypothetical protein
MALFATLGSLKVRSANSCARSAASRCPRRSTKRPIARRIAIRLAGHAAKRARPQCQAEIWPMIFSIVAPCTALSFHLPRKHSLAHTPKRLSEHEPCPTACRTPPRLPASPVVDLLGNVLTADEIGGDALRAPSLIFSNCLAKFPDHRLMKEMCHEKASYFALGSRACDAYGPRFVETGQSSPAIARIR